MPRGMRCPCGLAATYDNCCGRLHRGEKHAPTAELLMRARFSAYACRDEVYLRSSWHPSHRPRRVDFHEDLQWTRLEIVATTAGGLLDTEGSVEFRAYLERDGQPGVLAEHSRFIRHDGRWVYVDAIGASIT